MHPKVKIADTLSESDVHALIALLGGILPEALTSTEQTLTGKSRDSCIRTYLVLSHSSNHAVFVPPAIAFCRDLLTNSKAQDPENSSLSEIDVLRYKSAKCWAATANTLDTRSFISRLSTPINDVRREWTLLGRIMKKYNAELEDDETRSTFPALSRCGWTECSIYKPAHALRACKGCWRVAYCRPECQKTCVITCRYYC